jgi:hypothetical protein
VSTIRGQPHFRGGRPPAFDATDYKWRNVIERGFNNIKQWRGLATRYDKLALTYRAAAVRLSRSDRKMSQGEWAGDSNPAEHGSRVSLRDCVFGVRRRVRG